LELYVTSEIQGDRFNDNCQSEPKIFTYAEVVNLTGICVEHLHNFVKRHRLGFIARADETVKVQTDQLFFTPWDLTLLVTLFPRCTH
jgi:hypothetical protein